MYLYLCALVQMNTIENYRNVCDNENGDGGDNDTMCEKFLKSLNIN